MNYIEQIKAFWTLDKEHSFSGNESRLYFYLLELSNSLYWKNPLTNADGYTAAVVGISVNTLKTCRNRLQQAGLIRFKSGGSGARDKSVYEIMESENMLSKISNKVSNIDTLSTKSLIPYQAPYGQNTATINKQKHKLNNKTPYSPPLISKSSELISEGKEAFFNERSPLDRLKSKAISFEQFSMPFLSKLRGEDFDHFCAQWSLREIERGGYERASDRQLFASLTKYLNECVHRLEKEKRQKSEEFSFSTNR